MGKVNFSNGILKQPPIPLTAVCYCFQATYSLSFWTEHISASNPYRKTACVFKNPENAGIVRNISFQAKSCLFSPHEMFKNSGSVQILGQLGEGGVTVNDDISFLL